MSEQRQNLDSRWKQRLLNFEKAYLLLERTLKIESPSEAEIGGIIQFYELAFEQAWKLMKDYLEQNGFSVRSPREAIKQSFQSGLVEDGQAWIDALDDRNLTTHTYNLETAQKVVQSIRDSYFFILRQFYLLMKAEAEK